MLPKLLHQVWVGPHTYPEEGAWEVGKFLQLNPGYRYQRWTDVNLHLLGEECQKLVALATSYAAKADVVRLYALHKFGGVYFDVDFEFHKPLGNWEWHHHGWVGAQFREEHAHWEEYLSNAAFAAPPDSPWIAEQIAELPQLVSKPPPWGPALMTRVTPRHPQVQIISRMFLYPYHWDRPRWIAPESVASHKWALSWRKPSS